MSDSACCQEGGQFDRLSTDFITWLKQNPGFKVNPDITIADLRSTGAGRGVVALQDISEDEDLFVIPENLVLSVQNSKATELLNLNDEELGPWLSLIVVMIYEYSQGENSKWAPYFRILPSDFDTLMFWTDEELRELQGSSIVDKIGKADADQTLLEKVVPLIIKNPQFFPPSSEMSTFDIPQGKQALLSLAHRMGSLIMAYAFDIEKDEDAESPQEDGYVTDDEDEPAKGMVPFADLLNADADRNNARLFQEDGTLRMKSIKSIRAGEEVFNDYGELPRADLLRRYGYVTDNYAQYDVVDFPLSFICKAAGLESCIPNPNNPQLELLERFDILEDGYSISRPPSDKPLEAILPEELTVLLYTLCLGPEEINQFKLKNKAPKALFGITQASLLMKLVTEKQTEYATTILEDEQMLRRLEEIKTTNHNDETVRRRHKMAVQVRRGEKEILSQLSEKLNDYQQRQMREVDAKRSISPTVNSAKRQRRD